MIAAVSQSRPAAARRRLGAGLGVGAAALALAAAALPGVAAASIPVPVDGIPVPVVHTSGSNFGGSAGVPLVYADALNLGKANVAAAAVAPAESIVNSAGVKGQASGVTSYAHATNLAADLLSGSLPLNLVSPVTQATKHGTPKAKTGGLVNLPAAPLANVDVIANSAHAINPSTRTCSTTLVPLSHATEQVASADVLPGAVSGGSAVSVSNSHGGTVYTDSTVGLIQSKGQSGHEGVESEALTQLTNISLLNGAVQLAVAAPPTLVAHASGEPGGASITYNEPVIDVTLSGTKIGVLDNANRTLKLPGLGSLSLGVLQNKKVAANGTSASGSAALVDLDLSPGGVTLLNAQVAPATVSASVPKGGVTCNQGGGNPGSPGNPLRESHKDVSAAVVPPGSSFDYTVTVPNRSKTCTLQDVTVVDHLPAGLQFDSSVPPPFSRNGSTLTYHLGSLAPNQTKNITIHLTVPSSATPGTHYVNHATVTGRCGAKVWHKPVHVSGPTVGPVLPGGCRLADSNKAADHLQVVHGETYNYYIHVYNDGSRPCANVTVRDPIRAGESFVSCSDSCTESGGVVTWSLGTLGPGDSRTLTLTVKTTATSGVLENIARIHSPSAPAPVTVIAHGPAVTHKTVLAPPHPPAPSEPGGGNGGGGNGGGGNLPDTGGNPWVPTAGLGLLLAAAAVRRFARR